MHLATRGDGLWNVDESRQGTWDDTRIRQQAKQGPKKNALADPLVPMIAGFSPREPQAMALGGRQGSKS